MEQVTPVAQPLTVAQLRALHSNLNPDRVARRDGMSYLEAWDVKASLIKVFGYGGFSAECLEAKILRDEQIPQARDASKMNWAISAQATVRLTIPQLGAVYTESAIATNKQPDWGEAADTALKSAESDALKRAAIYLGTQFGLSLYDSGRTSDIITTVLSPGQDEIVKDINTSRVDSPEAEAAFNRLQARMKVHQTEAPAMVVEPTVTEPPAIPVTPVATVTAPATAVAKALENAERTAAELDQAQQDAPPRRKAPARKGTRKAPAKAATADRQAAARQALAAAEQQVGLTSPERQFLRSQDALLTYGPGDPDYEMDREMQIREDTGQ